MPVIVHAFPFECVKTGGKGRTVLTGLHLTFACAFAFEQVWTRMHLRREQTDKIPPEIRVVPVNASCRNLWPFFTGVRLKIAIHAVTNPNRSEPQPETRFETEPSPGCSKQRSGSRSTVYAAL